MATYKLLKTLYTDEIESVQITKDSGIVSTIPFDPHNTDYQEYLEWVDAGNTPDPAD